MRSYRRVRLSDLRGAYRLVAECRELGRDPLAWRWHLLAGLCRLTDAGSVLSGWTKLSDAPLSWAGLRRARASRGWLHYRRSDPELEPIQCRVWPGAPSAASLQQGGTNDWVFSRQLSGGSAGAAHVIALHPGEGRMPFDPRTRRLVRLLHHELGLGLGSVLAIGSEEPGPVALSPRLHEVLGCLLEGGSEKEIAARLSLSGRTLHEYVTALYRRFAVHSRAELMARFAHARPLPGSESARTARSRGTAEGLSVLQPRLSERARNPSRERR